MAHPPELRRQIMSPSEESSTTSSPTPSTTVTLTDMMEPSSSGQDQNQNQSVRLVLKKPKNSRKVNWTNETVDNEHMNKRKSKCCCIYKKPHVFGESSSESDEDECQNCFGHCELRKSDNPPPPPPSMPPVS